MTVETLDTRLKFDQRCQRLRREAASLAAVDPAEVRLVHSPYRICPLGAHVDHQLGRVTGMALDYGVLLAFAPSREGGMTLKSNDFDETIGFGWDDGVSLPDRGWGRYAAGAVRALRAAGASLERGLTGVVEGSLPIGGLSSSAAVTIAYLLALESINGAPPSAQENIRLEQYVEHVQIGLNNGILDQASILLSRRDQLLHLDCLDESWDLIAPAATAPAVGIVVAYSGLSAALASTGYNRRVAECQSAAAGLLERAGLPAPDRPSLRHVPPEVYREHGAALPPRARPPGPPLFFGERARHAGLRRLGGGRHAPLRRVGQRVGAQLDREL